MLHKCVFGVNLEQNLNFVKIINFYQQLLDYWFEFYSIQPETFKDIFVEPLVFNVNIIAGGPLDHCNVGRCVVHFV